MVIALKEAWAQDHLVTTKAIPAPLAGYMVHIVLQLPDSPPLHIVGLYRPNTSGWWVVHAEMVAYLETQMAVAGPDAQWLLGGDVNAVQRAADRSSGALRAIDTLCCDHLRRLNLESAFVRPSDAVTPMSYIRQRNSGNDCFSRIEYWLCRCGSELLASVRSSPQPEVLVDPDIDGVSDHRPIILAVPTTSLFASPPPVPQAPVARQARLKRPFTAAKLAAWRDGVLASTGPAAATLSLQLQGQDEHSIEAAAALHPAASSAIDDIVEHAVSQARLIFGVTKPAPPLRGDEQGRTWYLPRTLARQWQEHFKMLRLHRAVYRLAAKCAQGHITLAELCTHPVFAQYKAQPHMHPALSSDVPTSVSTLRTVLMPHLKEAIESHRTGMTDVIRTQRQRVMSKHAKTLRTQFWTNRARANAAVFGAADNNTGAAKEHISAIRHPIHHVVSGADRIREGLDWFHRRQMSPAVPACSPAKSRGARRPHRQQVSPPLTSSSSTGGEQPLAWRTGSPGTLLMHV